MSLKNSADWNLEEARKGLLEEIRRAKSRGDFELVSRLVDMDRLLSRGIRLNYQRLRSLYQQGWREGNPVGYLDSDFPLVEEPEE